MFQIQDMNENVILDIVSKKVERFKLKMSILEQMSRKLGEA